MQIINATILDIYEMVIVAFLLINKVNQIQFSEKIFPEDNVSLKIVIKIFFLILGDVNVDFLDQELCQKSYTIEEALLTTRLVELIGRKEFVAVVLDPKHETFIINTISLSFIASLNSTLLNIEVQLSHRPQIVGLIAKEAPTKIPHKYIDFADKFFPNLPSELLKYIRINNYAIELASNQQLLYKSIYSLKLIKIKTLKTYIETNLANEFIRLSKLPANTPIFFDWKLNRSFRLCVNYRKLNNLKVKN